MLGRVPPPVTCAYGHFTLNSLCVLIHTMRRKGSVTRLTGSKLRTTQSCFLRSLMALTVVVRNPDGDIGVQQVFFWEGRCCPDLDGWNGISEAQSTRATVPNSPWRIKRCPRTFEEAPNDRRARPNIFHRVRWILKGQFDLLPKYSLSAVASRPRMISQPVWKTIAASHSPAALIPRL